MRKITLLFVILILVAATAQAEWKEGPIVSYGRYQVSGITAIVSFEDGVSLERILEMSRGKEIRLAALSTRDGVSLPVEIYENLKGFSSEDFSHGLVTFPEGESVDRVLAELQSLPGILDASPNYLHRAFLTPNDPYYSQYQQNFKQIRVPGAWDSADGAGATVAVIDSGFKKAGMEDSPKNLLTGYDFWGEDSDVTDFIGHGTHVTNTVAERTDNGIGAAGIAYNATILPCKVFPDSDQGAWESDIIDAINWAVEQGADVINMSLGGGGYVSTTARAIDDAVDADCIVFAATGNEGNAEVEYPAAYDTCVAVGATREHAVGADPRRASFSNYGDALDLTAPGTNIVQETFGWQGQGYYASQGTSNACPHAAGVAALLVGFGGADALGIRESMESTAVNPNGDWTSELGFGEIDALAALQAYTASSDEKPVAIAMAFPSNGGAPLSVTFDGSESYDPDGDIDSYRWVLDGEILSKEESFDRVFQSAGTYLVTLRVMDDDGNAASDTVEVTVTKSASGGDCEQMLDTAYDGCKVNIEDEYGDYFEPELALDACESDDGTFPWECLLACYDAVEDCADFISCADLECEVLMFVARSEDADDDEAACTLCG